MTRKMNKLTTIRTFTNIDHNSRAKTVTDDRFAIAYINRNAYIGEILSS